MAKWTPQQATIIVQEPNTGKILALANRPTFNPNNYYDFPTKNFLNVATQEMFEPGSSFKPITMAIGLDLVKINPDTTYTDTGVVNVSGYEIKNYDLQAHGLKTMTQVLEKSLNTGSMFVQEQIGNEAFLDYLINMGFGQVTGIDLPGESAGDITNLYSGRKINFLTASFGQGIAVTPIQLINAYSMIANGGKLMRPYIVEKIIKENGEEVVTKPEVITIPIGEKTSTKLKSMLVSVVDHGFDRATVKGYDVAGKTGTAQIAGPDGGYLEGEFIHDFLGFAPAYNPKFVILIKMEKPQGTTYAADSLSPFFKEITEYLLTYYKVPPTR
jgi:cell division protein FtsI/penicillin-binding protein 2